MTDNDQRNSFEQAADDMGQSGGLVSEFTGFMRENAKWWLIPFLIVFGILAILLIFGSTGAAPFIYTMF